MVKLNKVWSAAVGICVLAIGGHAAAGPGDLLISPVRVVFEDRQRVAEVTLVNKGEAEAVYRISFENRRMTEDGRFEVIDEADNGEAFADKFVRFAPRRVVLAPNAPQTIRLMLRKPTDLADGEYRSHLHFAAVPDESNANAIEMGSPDAGGLAIELIPIYGVTIPIIVRHGTLNAEATIDQIDVSGSAAGKKRLSFRLSREGTRSLYGDVGIYVQGNEEPVLAMRGVAVYTPNKFRNMSIDVPSDVYASLKGKPLELRYEPRGGAATQPFATAQMATLN